MNDVERLFMYLLVICVSSLRDVYLGLCIFLDWIVYFLMSFMRSSYILEINFLSVASFANVISYFEGCFFFLFVVAFAVQNLFK